MLHFILFMLFSTLEGVAVYALALYIFRFDLRKYIWHCLIIIEIINVQNYLTRVEINDYAFLAPVANLLITILFLNVIVKIPLFWSAFVSIVSYASYIVIQTLFIGMFFTLDEIQSDPLIGYFVQFIPSTIGILTGYLLYRKGYGFSFDFNNSRVKRENYIVITFIILFLVFMTITAYLLDIYIGTFGFIAALIILLYYSFRKEVNDV